LSKFESLVIYSDMDIIFKLKNKKIIMDFIFGIKTGKIIIDFIFGIKTEKIVMDRLLINV
jgi:hypothetical protein